MESDHSLFDKSHIDEHSMRGASHNVLYNDSQLLFTDKSQSNVLSSSIISNCGKVEFCMLDNSVVCCFDSIEHWKVKDSMICGARDQTEGGGSTVHEGTVSRSIGHGRFELKSRSLQDCAVEGLRAGEGLPKTPLDPKTVDAVLKHFDAHNPRDAENTTWRQKIRKLAEHFREVHGIPTASVISPVKDEADYVEEIWDTGFKWDEGHNRIYGETDHDGEGVFYANRTWNASFRRNKEVQHNSVQRCGISDNAKVSCCRIGNSTLQHTVLCDNAHLIGSTVKKASTVQFSKLTRSYLKDISGEVKHCELVDSCLCCFEDLPGLRLSGIISCGSGTHGPRGRVRRDVTVPIRAGDNGFTLEGSEVSRDEWMDKHGLLVTGERQRVESLSASQGNPQACASDALTGTIELKAPSQQVDVGKSADIREPTSRTEDLNRNSGNASIKSAERVAGPATARVQPPTRDGMQSEITQTYRTPTGMMPHHPRMLEDGDNSINQGYRAEPMPEPRSRIDHGTMSDSTRAVRDGATASLAVPTVVAELATNHDNDANEPETSAENRSIMCCCPNSIKNFLWSNKEDRISQLTTAQSADRQGVVPSRSDVENSQEVEGQTNQLAEETGGAPRGPIELSGRQRPLEMDALVYTQAGQLPAASSHKGKSRQEADRGQ